MSPLLKRFTLIGSLFAILCLIAANPSPGPDAATCNQKLRQEISADVSRAVGVVLSSHRDILANAASTAARGQVTKARVAQGIGLVNPVARAVEDSVNTEFENLAPRMRAIIKVFIETGLKRLCTLDDCCFQQHLLP